MHYVCTSSTALPSLSMSHSLCVIVSIATVDVDLTGISKSRAVSFATGLYHTFMTPTIYSETNGVYLGFDNQVHQWPNSDVSAYHSDMSIWDTHRTQSPWLVLAAPNRARDVARSLVRIAAEGGDVPRWPLANVYTNCMDGSHGHAILADTWIKGVRDFDLASAYPAMFKEATQEVPHGGRVDIAEYIKYGYVPQDGDKKSGSGTLENAYNDYAIATIATALNKTADATMFYQRSLNYKNM
jgi:putative alpha-1,2-mannosidase